MRCCIGDLKGQIRWFLSPSLLVHSLSQPSKTPPPPLPESVHSSTSSLPPSPLSSLLLPLTQGLPKPQTFTFTQITSWVHPLNKNGSIFLMDVFILFGTHKDFCSPVNLGDFMFWSVDWVELGRVVKYAWLILCKPCSREKGQTSVLYLSINLTKSIIYKAFMHYSVYGWSVDWVHEWKPHSTLI